MKMSMRDYAVNDYGLVFNSNHMQLLASQLCDDYTDEGYKEDGRAYDEAVADILALEWISDFTGEAIYVEDDAAWGDANYYNSELIYYLGISKYPTLFKAAYNTVDDVIEEFKTKVGKYLPDNSPYRDRFRYIVGTYFG